MISMEGLENVNGTHLIRRQLTPREIAVVAENVLAQANVCAAKVEAFTTDGVNIALEVAKDASVYRLDVLAYGCDVAPDGEILVSKNDGDAKEWSRFMPALRWIAGELAPAPVARKRANIFAKLFSL